MELHRIPMYKTYDVVGYAYATEHYCGGVCVLEALGTQRVTAELAGVGLPFPTTWPEVEPALDALAAVRRLVREQTDSNDFPHVVTAGDESPDYCPRCAVCAGVLDGFDPADYATDTESE